MKRILVLAAGLFCAAGVRAQQSPAHPQYLMLTVFEDYGLGERVTVLETHDDGTQTKRELNWKSPGTYKRFIVHEDSVMVMLHGYFIQGWNLVSSDAAHNPATNSTFVEHYYLRREQ